MNIKETMNTSEEYREWQEFPFLVEPLHLRIKRVFPEKFLMQPYQLLAAQGKLRPFSDDPDADFSAGWYRPFGTIDTGDTMYTDNSYYFFPGQPLYCVLRARESDGGVNRQTKITYYSNDGGYEVYSVINEEGDVEHQEVFRSADVSEPKAVRTTKIAYSGTRILNVADDRYRQGWTTTREDGTAWIGHRVMDMIYRVAGEKISTDTERLFKPLGDHAVRNVTKWRWDDQRRECSYARWYTYRLGEGMISNPSAGYFRPEDKTKGDVFYMDGYTPEVQFIPKQMWYSRRDIEEMEKRLQENLGLSDSDRSDPKLFAAYVRRHIMHPIPFPRYTDVLALTGKNHEHKQTIS